ncbi:phage integrase central domain-containing protein [Pseudorhodoplanes sp.]|uniref:phage integrase central domain-containing protein n=1 Tax=Pseudorhodoplanes sp. TaxID=1934341 RepID=UPI003D13FC49
MASALALTARRVERLTSKTQGRIGWHKDGQTRGLLLQITRLADKDRPAAANWVLRYTLHGKERYFGLGSLVDFDLAAARERARKARQQIADGVDPVAARKAERAARALEEARSVTFKQAAEEYYERNHVEWKSLVHRQQYQSTMATYVYPVIGKIAVADVDRGLILKVLEPHWQTKTETMSRTRQRIEAVLAMSMSKGYREEGLNPARWKGNLDQLLPKPTKIAKVQHHPSLPYTEMPKFMAALRQRTGFAAWALELTILCATRTSETIGAVWSEFDLDNALWTIPKERMKAAQEHRIPLSDRAVELLRNLPRETGNDFVFCGTRPKTAISNMAMAQLLARMKYDHVTTHGMRATFRSWAADKTNYPEHVIEAALAHVVSDAVIRAYKRTTMFERRAKLMQAWADYCGD